MSWETQTDKLTVSGDGFAIFTVFDLQTGSLYSLNAIDATNSFVCEIAQEVEIKFAGGENTASDVISIECDNSVTVEVPKRKKIIDGLSGAEKAASGAAAVESIKVIILDSSKETLQKLVNMKDKPVAITVGLGKDTSGISRGVARLIGRRGEFTRKTGANAVVPEDITVSGGLSYDATGGTATYSAYNLAVTDPTPVGESAAMVIPDLTSNQYTALLAGEVVLT